VISPQTAGPLSRPLLVNRLPPGGLDVELKATPEECKALAADFKLPELKSLSGRFRVTGTAGHVSVKGRIEAEIVQICVVTLDSFKSTLDEEVEAEFAELPPDQRRTDLREDIDISEEGPDEIIDGRIDLGSLAAEFLALGLDPHPRKPGVDFAFEDSEAQTSPFSKLAGLKARDS
jgi:uncharacterized metal-binding protein YceD (DUF177 family)